MHTINVTRRVIGAVANDFPQYTEAEASADRALHLAALPAAIGAVSWLFLAAIPTAGIVQAIAYVIICRAAEAQKQISGGIATPMGNPALSAMIRRVVDDMGVRVRWRGACEHPRRRRSLALLKRQVRVAQYGFDRATIAAF